MSEYAVLFIIKVTVSDYDILSSLLEDMFQPLKSRTVHQLLVLAILIITVGVILFMGLEGWSFVNAFYFTVSLLTTVGFGDLTPTNELSRFIASIYMLLVVPLMLVMMGVVADGVFRFREQQEVEAHEAAKKVLKTAKKKKR